MIIKQKNVNNFIMNASHRLRSPDQRLIIGVTALATQPFIDLHNKKADEETRTLAACRSLGKIIAATTSGVIVRELCIKTIANALKKGSIEKLIPDLQDNAIGYTKFSNYLGSVAALGVMLFTNFLWDAPVTQKLTNFFYKNVSQKKETEKC